MRINLPIASFHDKGSIYTYSLTLSARGEPFDFLTKHHPTLPHTHTHEPARSFTMSDDWESVTKIGSKVRGGASQRETVVRGNSALNAAKRSGSSISTEKKYAIGNAAKGSTNGVGQFHTKVDRSDDIIKPKTLDKEVSKTIMKGRQAFTPVLTQAQLAQKTGKITATDVAKYERGELVPDQQTLSRMEGVLGIKLRGKDIGLPTAKALKEKERAEKAAAGK